MSTTASASTTPTVMTTAEAVALHGRAAVRHALASGRWQRPVRGVLVRHNGALAPDERRRVVLAACAPRSALAGATALELDGLTGVASPRTFVVLPEGARRPRDLPEGTTTHWSTLVEDVDVHPLRSPRRTRPERSLLDLATWAATDLAARAAVLAAFQQGLVTERTMLRTCDRRGTVGRSGLVRESVHDAVGGVHSLPERDLDQLLLVTGLPRPSRQRPVRSRDRRYYLDLDWEEFGVAAEVHGLPHHDVTDWTGDLHRANEVVIAGPRLLVFTSYAIRRQQEIVVDQLARALRNGGWTGIVKPLDTAERRRRRLRATWRAARSTHDDAQRSPQRPLCIIARSAAAEGIMVRPARGRLHHRASRRGRRQVEEVGEGVLGLGDELASASGRNNQVRRGSKIGRKTVETSLVISRFATTTATTIVSAAAGAPYCSSRSKTSNWYRRSRMM